MISRNVNDFKKAMADIHEYLGLDKYSNNNKENYMNLVDFLSQEFPNFQSVSKTDLDKEWNLISFNMKLKDKTATGTLKYIPNENSDALGTYEFTSHQNGKIKQ